MTYMGSPAKIEIEGLLPTLNSTDEDGVEWVFDTIQGWTGGAGVEVDRQQRTFGHGEFAQPGRRTGRPITVGGWVYCADDTMVARATDTLAAALADGSFGVLTVTDDRLGPRWAHVQLVGTIDDDWSKPNLYEFQLQLLAPEPYKYGALSEASTGLFDADFDGQGLVFDGASTTLAFEPSLDFGATPVDSGSISLENVGTAAANVRFVVEGPTPDGGFAITDQQTGLSIFYYGVVLAGNTLVLDGRNGSILLNGTTDRYGDALVEAWPTIPPGSTRDFLFVPLADTSAATLTGSAYATYW